LSWVWG